MSDSSSGSDGGERRFAPPPAIGPRSSGSIALGLGPDVVAGAVVEGLAVAIATIAGAACVYAPLRWEPFPITLGALMLAPLWTMCVLARVPRRARIEWDEHAITMDAAGARIAIPWGAAHVCAVRSDGYRILQVRDTEGRSIVCVTGRGLPRWVQGRRAWASASDYERLLAAVENTKRVPSLQPTARIGGAPLAPIASALGAVVAFAVHHHLSGRAHLAMTLGAVAIVLLLAVIPALAEAVAALRRGWTLAAARVVSLGGGLGEPLQLRNHDGSSIVADVGELVRDARLGERGEPVRAVVAADPEQAPYRGREKAHIVALESQGEASLRRRRLATAIGRTALIGSALVMAGVALATAPPPRERAAFTRPESLSRPAPEPPRAWMHDPRDPEPPPMDSIVQLGCDDLECRQRRYLVDQRGEIVYACDQQAPAPCTAAYRAELAAAEREGRPMPPPIVLPATPTVRLPTIRPGITLRLDCSAQRCVPVITEQTPEGPREIVCRDGNLRACRALLDEHRR